MAALEEEIDQIQASTTAELEHQRVALEEEHEELRRVGERSRRQRREFEAEKSVLEDDRAAMVQEIKAHRLRSSKSSRP